MLIHSKYLLTVLVELEDKKEIDTFSKRKLKY
jgi:hypothetical protein